jgi:LysM repeat protein
MCSLFKGYPTLPWASLVLVGALLLLGCLAAIPGPAYAQATCSETYTVQRGDYLYAIARRFNTTVGELLRLNPSLQANPNLIVPGQVLCLPAASDGTAASQSKVVIELTYHYTPDPVEEDAQLEGPGGVIGKRLVYPLASADAMDVITETTQMQRVLQASPLPLFIVVRDSVSATTYQLVAIGQQTVLDPLRISETGALSITAGCAPTPLNQALGLDSASGTLLLEAGNGTFYPFAITSLNFMPDQAAANQCYNGTRIALALFPGPPGGGGPYRLSALLMGNAWGPPSWTKVQRCSRWAGYGRYGRYGWLRSWYGC